MNGQVELEQLLEQADRAVHRMLRGQAEIVPAGGILPTPGEIRGDRWPRIKVPEIAGIRRVWVFSMGIPTSRGTSQFIRRISDLQVTDVALMLNQYKHREFELTWSKARIVDTATSLRDIGVAPHLVTWLRPTESYMRDAAASLRDLCIKTSVRSLIFDAEEPWTLHPNIKGRGQAGARDILSRYWSFFTGWPCLLGVSGVPYIPETVKPLAEVCDFVLPQAYSTHIPERRGRSCLDNRVYRPVITQRTAHKRWRDFGKPIVMGLAAFSLCLFGGLSRQGAMQKAITATEDLRDPMVGEVAYWSIESLKSSEKVDFVRQAAIKARRGISQKMSLSGGSFEYKDFGR